MSGNSAAIGGIDSGFYAMHNHVKVRVILYFEVDDHESHIVRGFNRPNFSDRAGRNEMIALRRLETGPDEPGDHDNSGSKRDEERLAHLDLRQPSDHVQNFA